ncbi:glycosyltransferase family 2 protein [Priestia koreensis]|uniref:Glycosyltransferase n=1 Tax=Priestia koreensis TaxID=284581 RepID=A0A0M0KZI0_9BACI|nr:glycosyltransferase family 2 protein [Priestia koreensis]KOO44235.1 glycosyltransferase [Priestia koreensis]UNL83092.1 glycosyltransferase family 2 protein [Priestia koreensis]
MKKHVRYSIVIPVYNEEAVIHETYRRLKSVMNSTKEAYELLFVNDGSRDQTAAILKGYSDGDDSVKLIDFSRNFGHQIAITAGMDYARGEAIVVIDADLQDPPELILEMIEKWKEGYDVVYAKRVQRKGETFFKKQTASLFYRILRASTDVDIPVDTGDFRLIDRRVCEEMKGIQEKNRFVRGLVSWVGFKQTAVEYVRDERLAGETKYPLKKMLKLSLDGLTTFSYKPLKLATYTGSLLSLAGFIYMFIVLYQKLFTDSTVEGWASLIVIQLFFSGIVLILLGIVGEYIGRIYDETKNRPLYIVRECYGMERKERQVVSSVVHE